MSTSRWQAVFFDFDGVIADSVQVKTKAFAIMFKQYGQDAVDRVIAYHLANGGMPRYLKFAYCFKEIIGKDLNRDQLDQLGVQFSALVVDGVVAADYIPGAQQTLALLEQEDIPAYIVSGTPHEEMIAIAARKGLERFFVEIHGSPRTKTEILQDILNRHSYSPRNCLFVGDALADYRAALDTGMKFLGITGPNSTITFPEGTRLSPTVTTDLTFERA